MVTVQSGPDGPFTRETLPDLRMAGLDDIPQFERDDT